MSYCQQCHQHYREPADEQGDHPCPKCGRLPHERVADLDDKPTCRCSASTGIHERTDADGTAERPWGLTFGRDKLDEYGYWEHGCEACARWHEQANGVPIGSYWPFPA